MDRLIAIGDIHGCYHTLQALLDKVSYNKDSDILVFIGDYIDRGCNSYEVITLLRHLQHEAGEEKVICLRGNHEQMAIDACESSHRSLWIRNGGQATIDSFRRNKQSMVPAIEWFESLPLVYDTPEILFCHAGLSRPLLKDNTPDDLIWGRDWIYCDRKPREKQVVFGHTPSRNGTAYMTDTGDICIDAACVFGKNLCALIIQEDGASTCIYEPKSPKDNFS